MKSVSYQLVVSLTGLSSRANKESAISWFAGSLPSPVEVVRITIDHLQVDIFVKVASWKSKGIPPPIAPPRENKLIRPYDDNDDHDDDDDA